MIRVVGAIGWGTRMIEFTKESIIELAPTGGDNVPMSD
jgi:hypothetical protein